MWAISFKKSRTSRKLELEAENHKMRPMQEPQADAKQKSIREAQKSRKREARLCELGMHLRSKLGNQPVS
jgi:hypothetical protein